jgi:hypothetical protein
MTTAAIGHNNPPLDESVVSDFEEALAFENDGLLARLQQLLDGSERASATDAESAGRCADLARMMKAAVDKVEEVRERFNRPLLTAQRSLMDAKNMHCAPLIEARNKVIGMVDTFRREEEARVAAERRRLAEEARIADQQRRDREEAARREAEALDASIPEPEPEPEPEAPPPVVEQTVIRGDYGGKVVRKTEWKAEIQNWELALAAVSDNDKVREAAEKAITRMVKAGQRKIAGVRVYEDSSTQIR